MQEIDNQTCVVSKAQKEARTHNWNKACLISAQATLHRTLNYDARLSMGSRAHLVKAYKRIQTALERW